MPDIYPNVLDGFLLWLLCRRLDRPWSTYFRPHTPTLSVCFEKGCSSPLIDTPTPSEYHNSRPIWPMTAILLQSDRRSHCCRFPRLCWCSRAPTGARHRSSSSPSMSTTIITTTTTRTIAKSSRRAQRRLRRLTASPPRAAYFITTITTIAAGLRGCPALSNQGHRGNPTRFVHTCPPQPIQPANHRGPPATATPATTHRPRRLGLSALQRPPHAHHMPRGVAPAQHALPRPLRPLLPGAARRRPVLGPVGRPAQRLGPRRRRPGTPRRRRTVLVGHRGGHPGRGARGVLG